MVRRGTSERGSPLYPLLFAAYAVLFLYAANLDAGAPGRRRRAAGSGGRRGRAGVGGVLRWSSATSGAARSSRRRPSWRSSPSATSSGGLAANGLDDRAQLALWAVVIVAALVYAIRARGSLASVTAGLNVFAVVLVVIAGDLDRAVRAASRGAAAHHPRAGGPRQRDPRPRRATSTS